MLRGMEVIDVSNINPYLTCNKHFINYIKVVYKWYLEAIRQVLSSMYALSRVGLELVNIVHTSILNFSYGVTYIFCKVEL
jgi:hypothetical protein